MLLLGVGNGRNIPPFVSAGISVIALESDPGRAAAMARRFAHDERVRIVRTTYDLPLDIDATLAGALATHALLHGTPATIAACVRAVRAALHDRGWFFATVGSTADPRYGHGTRVAADTFVTTHGSEAGVPHAFFDETGVHALFAGFELESLVEESAAQTVGTWAHEATHERDVVHWFVRAQILLGPAHRSR